MDSFLAFGDVFRFRETEYVYLAGVDQITYAAKILEPQLSRKVITIYERVSSRGGAATRLEDSPVYCFVVLRTPDYVNRVANYAQQGTNEITDAVGFEKLTQLIPEDIEELRKAVIGSKGVSQELRDLVRLITL